MLNIGQNITEYLSKNYVKIDYVCSQMIWTKYMHALIKHVKCPFFACLSLAQTAMSWEWVSPEKYQSMSLKVFLVLFVCVF